MSATSDVLQQIVRSAARRLTLQRSFRTALLAGTLVLAGLVAATVSTLVFPLTPVSFTAGVAAAIGTVAVILLLLTVGRPVEMLTAARVLDLRAELAERTSTAWEVSAAAVTPLRRRVLDDAAAHARTVDLRRTFPWRLPRAARVWAALLLVLLLWPYTLRGVAVPGSPAHRTRQAIRQEGSRLERFARTLAAKTRAQRTPQTRRVAPQMRDLGARLQQERVDRAEALARIAQLSRQIDAARRDIESRVSARRQAPQDGTLPQELSRRQALQQQIRQLRELTSRLQQNPEAASQDVLQRLGQMTQSGDGNQPARVPQQLQRAREQLQQGNPSGAGGSLTEALRELEGLDSMLADAEGLSSAQRQLQRSQQAIASGSSGRREGDVAEDDTGSRGRPAAPGENPLRQVPGAEAQAPEGPHEGVEPGQGRVTDKMGAPSPRLESPRMPDRLHGTQSEGPVSSAEVIGAGRPGTPRRPTEGVTPAIVAQADRAMETARTPGRYRALIRRYFQRLAALR